MENSKEILRSM